MKLGATSVTFRQLAVNDVIELFKCLDGIEWGGDIHVPAGDILLAKDVYKRTVDAGLSVLSYGSYYRLCSNESFSPVCKTAVAIKAPQIRVWAGNAASAAADINYFKMAVSNLKKIATEAASEGIRIGLEYHPNTLTDNFQTAKKLLCEANEENVFTYWQPNNSLSVEEHLKEITTLREYIGSVHVFNWDSEKRLPLCDGKSTWKKYIEALGNKDIPYIMEFVKDDSAEQFIKDAKALKSIF